MNLYLRLHLDDVARIPFAEAADRRLDQALLACFAERSRHLSAVRYWLEAERSIIDDVA